MAQKQTNGKADQEEELVMVGDGIEEGEELDKESDKPGAAKSEDAAERPTDKRQGHSEYDYPDDDEEGSESGEQSSERGGDRKLERKSRKARQREARDRDRMELTFLRNRNEQLERRFSAVETRVVQNETNAIEQRIGQVRTQIQAADEVMKAAMKAQNGEDFVEAQKLRDQLVRQEALLQGAKQQRVNAGKQTPQLDPAHVEQATRFAHSIPWYNANGTDKDSKKMNEVDAAVLNDGYDPASPAYYQELERRAKKALPHRFKAKAKDDEDEDEDDDEAEDEVEEETPQRRSKPKGGPTFRTGGRNVTLKKGQVYVSRERREAMEQAGVWDDPVLRKQYLGSYARYDRENTH